MFSLLFDFLSCLESSNSVLPHLNFLSYRLLSASLYFLLIQFLLLFSPPSIIQFASVLKF
jgi:hypothetical protein